MQIISYKRVVVPSNVFIFKHGELISRGGSKKVIKKLSAYMYLCKYSSWFPEQKNIAVGNGSYCDASDLHGERSRTYLPGPAHLLVTRGYPVADLTCRRSTLDGAIGISTVCDYYKFLGGF
jgi:hypothetical protein